MTTVEQYRQRFSALELEHGEDGASRRAALEAYCAAGPPTSRLEEWRYTKLDNVLETNWHMERGAPAWQTTTEGIPAEWLSEGQTPSASPHGVLAEPQHSFAALNRAFGQGVLSIDVPAGTIVERPLRVRHHLEGGVGVEVHPQVHIRVGPGARVTLVEEFTGTNRGFVNLVSIIELEGGAVLDHQLWQHLDADVSLIAHCSVQVGAGASYENVGLWLGGALSRAELGVALVGEAASCRVDGVYAASGGQQVDVYSHIDHRVPRCRSRQTYKGLLGERGHGVFLGKVTVREGAQQTDASQSNHNLLLAETAEIDTKPQLEIFADDVKCAHGTTVGQLDDEQLFYLRSRGLGSDEATRLLTGAFALEVTDTIALEDLRGSAATLLEHKLARLVASTETPS
ncbi:MAG: Fe-S cluster assembly protein SufD [Myxococcota bacterium]